MIAKGTSKRRAEALARQVRRWDAYDDDRLGEVFAPVDYGRPVRVFVKGRLKEGSFRHSNYVSTLLPSSKGLFMAYYNQHGGAEIEQFRNGKSGLNLTSQKNLLGSEGCVSVFRNEPKSEADSSILPMLWSRNPAITTSTRNCETQPSVKQKLYIANVPVTIVDDQQSSRLWSSNRITISRRKVVSIAVISQSRHVRYAPYVTKSEQVCSFKQIEKT